MITFRTAGQDDTVPENEASSFLPPPSLNRTIRLSPPHRTDHSQFGHKKHKQRSLFSQNHRMNNVYSFNRTSFGFKVEDSLFKILCDVTARQTDHSNTRPTINNNKTKTFQDGFSSCIYICCGFFCRILSSLINELLPWRIVT